MPNTCKSHGSGVSALGQWRTGEERVGIYPQVGDNRGKLRLIPHDEHALAGMFQSLQERLWRSLRPISLLVG